MARYLVAAKPKYEGLRDLWQLLEAGRIMSLQPFGPALEASLRGAKLDSTGTALWEEEDYCTPPLAQERAAVLDRHFDEVQVQLVAEGEGWARIRHQVSLWIGAFGLPPRRGARPRTTSMNPHRQLTQNAPVRMYQRLAERLFTLPEVEEQPSLVSVPGARALWLTTQPPRRNPEAFMAEQEFAHLHPPDDGSLHLTLPSPWREDAITKGWAEPHPRPMMAYMPASDVLLYGPRDESELEVVYNLVVLSYHFARGDEVKFRALDHA